jgi:hypothetical protein
MRQDLYYGITPTDESAMGFGEIQILINETCASVQIAGGLRIHIVRAKLDDFVPMSCEEIMPDQDAESCETLADRYEGFKHRVGGVDGIELIFIKHPGLRDPDIIVHLGMADLLGPTMLWRKDRLITYLIKGWVRWCDFRTKGGIPLLSRNGRVASHV